MIIVTLIALILVTIYWWGTENFDYWKKRGVKHDKPIMWFGNNAANYFGQKSMTQIAVEKYYKYPNERVVGFFRSTKPELIIRDPELIKRILTTDFNHFHYRGLNFNKSVIEPIMRNLFHSDGDLWRLLRQRMTPAFTSGKLKAMFPLIVERTERLKARALDAANKEQPLDARELMARYTTDFIGACGFGLDADTLKDETSEFRKLGAKIFNITPLIIFRCVLKEFFPELFKHIHIFSYIEDDVNALVDNILRQRNNQPTGRNDFIDILLECQKKGLMVGESLKKKKSDGTPEQVTMELTQQLFAAQVFVFFAAGFETSSSATSYTLHQLAFNPDVQKRVQEDVDRVLAKHDNKLSYDAVKDMTYLDWTFKEGMRMFPSLGFLFRQCSHPYTFTDFNFSVDENVNIMIPIQAIQNDPKYFDDPEKFRPERFDPEIFDSDKKFHYLPFGDGPRACIAARLGRMQSLAGLAAIMAHFTVTPAPTSLKTPVVDSTSSIVQSIKNGLPLMFHRRAA